MLWFSANLLSESSGRYTWLPLMVILLCASFTDIRSHRIPNMLTFPAGVAGVLIHLAANGFAAAASALLAYVLFFIGGFLFYRWIGGIGAGDIKLLMACASFLGMMPALYVAFFSFLLQSCWMFIRWFWIGTAFQNIRQLAIWLYSWMVPGIKTKHFHPMGTPDRSPHGPFIFAGAIVTALLNWGKYVNM